VVIGTTGDPTTPLKSSAKMAETLEDGRLVVVDANRHGGYLGSSCAQDIVADYLVWLEPPADETTC
jgi:TAP-like protein